MRTYLTSISLAVLVTCFGAQAADAPALPQTAPGGIMFADITKADGDLLWRYMTGVSGKALYTFDADGNTGKSTCVDQCAQEFIPYPASANAKATGDWSLVERSDGQRQWAYRGRPLYSYSGKDPSGGRPRGIFAGELSLLPDPKTADPTSDYYTPKQGWRRAAFTPEESVAMPAGIQLQSWAVANGYGFADQTSGMPLYVMKTAPKKPAVWTPKYAPNLAKPVGDFSIVVREDGKRQWAFKGQALYTYNSDYAPDDLNGLAEQNDVRPALVYQHFMPRAVRVEFVPFRGPMLVTAKGMSVYVQSRGGRRSSTRNGGRISAGDAKALGTVGCVESCLKTWVPILASAEDQASGFWEILDRADGTKQWAYRGAALYTYAGDKKPGDIQGANMRTIVYGDPEGKIDLTLTGGNRGTPNVRQFAGSALSWNLPSLYN